MANAPAPVQRVWAPENQQGMALGPLHNLGSISGANIYVDCNNGPNQRVTIVGTGKTLTLFNQADGSVVYLRITQGAAGNHTVTTWANVHFAGGTEPTLSTAAGAVDWFRFTWQADLSKWFGETLGKDFKA